MNQHFDGRGHRTCDFRAMIEKYAHERASLAILRQLAPFKYVVMPDVEIKVSKRRSGQFEVVLIWPGETRRVCHDMSDRRRRALVRLYKSGSTDWRFIETDDQVTFYRHGKIVPNVTFTDYRAMSAEG